MSAYNEDLEHEIRCIQQRIDHLYTEVQQNPKDLFRIYSQIASYQQNIQSKRNWIKNGGKGPITVSLPKDVTI